MLAELASTARYRAIPAIQLSERQPLSTSGWSGVGAGGVAGESARAESSGIAPHEASCHTASRYGSPRIDSVRGVAMFLISVYL